MEEYFDRSRRIRTRTLELGVFTPPVIQSRTVPYNVHQEEQTAFRRAGFSLITPVQLADAAPIPSSIPFKQAIRNASYNLNGNKRDLYFYPRNGALPRVRGVLGDDIMVEGGKGGGGGGGGDDDDDDGGPPADEDPEARDGLGPMGPPRGPKGPPPGDDSSDDDGGYGTDTSGYNNPQSTSSNPNRTRPAPEAELPIEKQIEKARGILINEELADVGHDTAEGAKEGAFEGAIEGVKIGSKAGIKGAAIGAAGGAAVGSALGALKGVVTSGVQNISERIQFEWNVGAFGGGIKTKQDLERAILKSTGGRHTEAIPHEHDADGNPIYETQQTAMGRRQSAPGLIQRATNEVKKKVVEELDQATAPIKNTARRLGEGAVAINKMHQKGTQQNQFETIQGGRRQQTEAQARAFSEEMDRRDGISESRPVDNLNTSDRPTTFDDVPSTMRKDKLYTSIIKQGQGVFKTTGTGKAVTVDNAPKKAETVQAINPDLKKSALGKVASSFAESVLPKTDNTGGNNIIVQAGDAINVLKGFKGVSGAEFTPKDAKPAPVIAEPIAVESRPTQSSTGSGKATTVDNTPLKAEIISAKKSKVNSVKGNIISKRRNTKNDLGIAVVNKPKASTAVMKTTGNGTAKTVKLAPAKAKRKSPLPKNDTQSIEPNIENEKVSKNVELAREIGEGVPINSTVIDGKPPAKGKKRKSDKPFQEANVPMVDNVGLDTTQHTDKKQAVKVNVTSMEDLNKRGIKNKKKGTSSKKKSK